VAPVEERDSVWRAGGQLEKTTADDDDDALLLVARRDGTAAE
jgi:hypothetical protein